MMPSKLKSQFSYLFFILAIGALLMGVSNCGHFPIDQAVSAEKGNDYVVVLSGYGQASTKGYLFLQANEKAETNKPITMTLPNVVCKTDSCAHYQFFRKDGSAGHAGSIKKGQSQISFPLSEIVGHTGLLAADDEGEYSVVVQVLYTGADGQEYSMLGNGFVRVNVLSEAYRPISCGDPSVAWKVSAGVNCQAQFTSAFRTALCGKGCD